MAVKKTATNTIELIESKNGDMLSAQNCPSQDRTLNTTSSTFRLALCIFILLFLMAIAALETLNYESGQHQGIATVSEARHYLWTYGPTFGEQVFD